MRTLIATYLFDPKAVAAGWEIMRITVGYDRDILMTSREHPWPPRGSGQPGQSRYRVDRWCGGEITSLMLPETTDFIWHAQTAPAGRWLIVKHRASNAEVQNARLYEPDGQFATSFHAGDGIEDVQATETGEFWVSYFDEGVFGRRDEHDPSPSGLVCFDGAGKALFQYNRQRTALVEGLPPIHDCYALNVVARAEIWLYYYSTFPLVCLKERRLATWWPDVRLRFQKAFAVTEGHVLFAARPRQRDDSLCEEQFSLVSLESLATTGVRIADEHGTPVVPAARHHACFGRAERLYVQAENGLFMVDLHQLGEV